MLTTTTAAIIRHSQKNKKRKRENSIDADGKRKSLIHVPFARLSPCLHQSYSCQYVPKHDDWQRQTDICKSLILLSSKSTAVISASVGVKTAMLLLLPIGPWSLASHVFSGPKTNILVSKKAERGDDGIRVTINVEDNRHTHETTLVSLSERFASRAGAGAEDRSRSRTHQS